ncbi:hypothetical protein CICLE_v10017997mg [Citrus x clementina]|uniref:S-protein homolog n=1 Tax=Citrus clementina TaxID=85681 RepID=V4U4C6_CITCL|nr:hypothetical protein CICLE_v10017997mg [Citrus x clementina]
MGVHCKSGDDDLGGHVIPHKSTYNFSFHPNFWGTTQFYWKCEWQSTYEGFDIFVGGREDCGYCSWSITADGPLFKNYLTMLLGHPKWSKLLFTIL